MACVDNSKDNSLNIVFDELKDQLQSSFLIFPFKVVSGLFIYLDIYIIKFIMYNIVHSKSKIIDFTLSKVVQCKYELYLY